MILWKLACPQFIVLKFEFPAYNGIEVKISWPLQ